MGKKLHYKAVLNQAKAILDAWLQIDEQLTFGPVNPGALTMDINHVRGLEEQITQHELPMEAFQWYLDLRRYGSVPHAGFGMGIERCTAWMCGIEHIRETIPFPRMLYRIRP